MLFINLQCTTVTKDTPKLNTVAPSTQSCPDGRGPGALCDLPAAVAAPGVGRRASAAISTALLEVMYCCVLGVCAAPPFRHALKGH